MEGMNSSIIYLIQCKNFCKCPNVPPCSTPIIILKIFWKKKEVNPFKIKETFFDVQSFKNN
jgi:hypothetical protein